MSDEWDERVKAFLTKTGEEFRRFSHDVRQDAQRLLSEARDPATRRKLKDGLAEVGTWARRTAEEVATVMESGVRKAEAVLATPVGPSDAATDAAPTAPSPPPVAEASAPPPAPLPRPKEKTVGRATQRRLGPAKKVRGKKTIGRRPRSGTSRE